LLFTISACGRNTNAPRPHASGASVPAESPATAGSDGAGHVEAATPAEPPRGPPPLSADGEFVSLPVTGFRDAVVSLPLGATTKRPIVLALHGNFDRPEWQCEVWRGIVQTTAFVLCPRGTPRADAPGLDRWEYGSRAKTRDELEAALAALRERYADYVADGPVVFTGFSLGAILGVGIVQSDPQRFARVVLTEGGQRGWSRATAKAFKAGGGERVLFACGQAGCVQNSKTLVTQLEKEGVLGRVVSGGKAGHTYDGPVARAIADSWAWLTEGDPRFE
jgi:poly(3-hydroxybutyrate) depolymerase